MPLTRKPHWDTKHLHAFLNDRVATPFCWGTNDCAMYAADAVLAMTGTDIASDLRGKYTTELGALKAIKTIAGGSTVADAVEYCANKHGLTEHKFPLMAKRGDLVVIDNGGNEIAGIVHLNGRHVTTVSDKGIVRLPITSILRAWSI